MSQRFYYWVAPCGRLTFGNGLDWWQSRRKPAGKMLKLRGDTLLNGWMHLQFMYPDLRMPDDMHL